jgi:hypothetical protein
VHPVVSLKMSHRYLNFSPYEEAKFFDMSMEEIFTVLFDLKQSIANNQSIQMRMQADSLERLLLDYSNTRECLSVIAASDIMGIEPKDVYLFDGHFDPLSFEGYLLLSGKVYKFPTIMHCFVFLYLMHFKRGEKEEMFKKFYDVCGSNETSLEEIYRLLNVNNIVSFQNEYALKYMTFVLKHTFQQRPDVLQAYIHSTGHIYNDELSRIDNFWGGTRNMLGLILEKNREKRKRETKESSE